MNVTWGLPIWIYLWLCGMAAGAYFAAFLADYFSHRNDRQLTRSAIYLGVPLAITGVFFLIIDLGHPLRFWHLILTFKVVSPMSIGGWSLLAGVGIAILIVFLWHSKRWFHWSSRGLDRAINLLYWIDLFVAIFLMSYTGVLLAASNQPLWMSTVLLPSLFVISATSTGVALLVAFLLLTRAWQNLKDVIPKLIRADVIVIAIELIVLVGYLFWLSQTPISGANEAMARLTTGALAARFWIGVILLAILIPFALDIFHWSRSLELHKKTVFILGLSSLCVIVGGVILREVFVVGGQM